MKTNKVCIIQKRAKYCIAILAMLVCFAHQGSAQIFQGFQSWYYNTPANGSEDKFNDLAIASDGTMFLLGTTKGPIQGRKVTAGYDQPFIISVNLNKILWSIVLDSARGIDMLDSNKLIVDKGDGWQTKKVAVFSTSDGSKLWENTFTIPYSNYPLYDIVIKSSQEGNFALFGIDYGYKITSISYFNSSGKTVFSGIIPQVNATSLNMSSDGLNMVLSGSDKSVGNPAIEVHSLGSDLGSLKIVFSKYIPGANTFNAVCADGNYIYALCSGTGIFKYDYYGNEIAVNTNDIYSSKFGLAKMFIKNGQVFVIDEGSYAWNMYTISKYNLDLSFESFQKISISNFEAYKIGLGNHVGTCGYSSGLAHSSSGNDAEYSIANIILPPPSMAQFNSLGGYQAYLAANVELFNQGICDEVSAYNHWANYGRNESRGFDPGQLRSDLPGGATDPNYAISGGWCWQYTNGSSTVFISADAPKPRGWSGDTLLLKRGDTFNLGPAYSAAQYAQLNADVANAINSGAVPSFKSVTDHYVKYGFKEGRISNVYWSGTTPWTQSQLNAWNNVGYMSANPDVNSFFQNAASRGWVLYGKVGFAHYINFGRFEGRSTGQ